MRVVTGNGNEQELVEVSLYINWKETNMKLEKAIYIRTAQNIRNRCNFLMA